MASDNTSPQAGTKTADAESTQPMAPVESSKSSTSAETSEPASAQETPANGSPATTGSANGSAASTSSVKDGAVKAAAAALAAARNAAKKVQSAGSAASGTTGPEAPGASTGSSQSAPPPPPPGSSSSAQSGSRPQMHYSVGGLHGSAQQSAGTGSPEPAAQTGAQPVAASDSVASARRVRLSVSRIDPWSIMKLAFLLSVAIGIMIVVATAVVWFSLNELGTFATMQEFLIETMGPQAINITEIIQFERMISLSMLIAIVNMVLFTAIATIAAILYNITAALVGGVHLTLTDE